MALKEYKAKRNFSRTQEPAGKIHQPRASPALRFVVQKHDATRLHYDFRLEMEGVLKSWAVPKGFPTQKGDRRLAIEVEDHPVEYANFEGTIPEGNYGAGTVMVWDTGTYQVSGDDPLEALRSGKVHLTLSGSKLKGEWTLVRMRGGSEDKPQWLLLKSGSDAPAFSERVDNQSAITRRTMQQIAKADGAEWQSNRKGGSRHSGVRKSETKRLAPPADIDPKLPHAPASFVEPMKALLVEAIPKGPAWIYEVKFDGIRALAIKRDREVRLISRTEKDMTLKYPQVVSALKKLPVTQAVLDGEIVAVDPEGRPSFQLLQRYHIAGVKKPPLFYYVFDLINLEGRDLRTLPLDKRKALAEPLLKPMPDVVRFSAGLQAHSSSVINEMQRQGLEGLIAKRKDSKYEAGRRSGSWLKFKWTNEQEFVIGGYTQPKGSRAHFGALLVGYYDTGKLLFAAKVGTGFDEKLLASLYQKLQKLLRPDCPFANLPEKAGSHGRGLTAREMQRCAWVAPRLVGQVRFSEWTRDHHLRQPAFLGLREDKKPEEVVREIKTK